MFGDNRSPMRLVRAEKMRKRDVVNYKKIQVYEKSSYSLKTRNSVLFTSTLSDAIWKEKVRSGSG